jgi:hypothetical protein
MVYSAKSEKPSCEYAGCLTGRILIDAILTRHLEALDGIVREKLYARKAGRTKCQKSARVKKKAILESASGNEKSKERSDLGRLSFCSYLTLLRAHIECKIRVSCDVCTRPHNYTCAYAIRRAH